MEGCQIGRILVLAAAVLMGCHGAMRGARVEAPWIHPMLGGAQDLPQSGPRPRPPEVRPAEGPSKVGTQARARTPPPLALPRASTDETRAELVESARRLVGVVRSFDERSFLWHIMRVNALLPRGVMASSWTAAALLDAAQKEGRVVPTRDAAPGDIIVFECPSGCGAAASEKGLAAGVVERVADGRIEFIAYVEGQVQRCWCEGDKDPGPSFRRIQKVVAVVAVGAPPLTGSAKGGGGGM